MGSKKKTSMFVFLPIAFSNDSNVINFVTGAPAALPQYSVSAFHSSKDQLLTKAKYYRMNGGGCIEEVWL